MKRNTMHGWAVIGSEFQRAYIGYKTQLEAKQAAIDNCSKNISHYLSEINILLGDVANLRSQQSRINALVPDPDPGPDVSIQLGQMATSLARASQPSQSY